MKTVIASLLVAAPFVAACGASYPPPNQPMADAKAADRTAAELGANQDPAAQLPLKLADEEIQQADAAMKAGDNRRAQFLLVRAKADAELAVALAREKSAKAAASKAAADAAEQSKKLQGAGQ
jgi:Domain of unknown function (DUF4398)